MSGAAQRQEGRDGFDVRDLMARVPEWEREALKHERQAAALRQMIDGARLLNGEVAPLGMAAELRSLESARPPMRQAILLVMDTAPNRIWKLIEIRRELLRRGWMTSSKAVDTAMKRVLDAGYVRNPRYGFYCYPAVLDEKSSVPEEAPR